MIKQNGSILIVSLLFLSVMFCVFLIFSETEIFQIRQFAAAKRQFELSQMAENKLKEVENKILMQSLRNDSEEINNFKVSYRVESLGEYECVVIENKIARFFRIDVFVENVLHEKLHLASTVAYPTSQESFCKIDKQLISAGRQSWYQFE